MANRQRGEVGVTVDGVEYRLRLDFEAMCQLEDLVDMAFDEVMAKMFNGRMGGLRALMWCALQYAHSAEIKTLRDASDWVQRVGASRAAKILDDVFAANTEEGTEKKADPPTAQAGTGETSTSELAALA